MRFYKENRNGRHRSEVVDKASLMVINIHQIKWERGRKWYECKLSALHSKKLKKINLKEENLDLG